MSFDGEFAGFSHQEWVKALSRLMSADSAEEVARDLFDQVERQGSNGYSLPAEMWAMLAYANEGGEERVRDSIRFAPEQFRNSVWSRLEQERAKR